MLVMLAHLPKPPLCPGTGPPARRRVGKRGIVYSYLGQRPEVPHVDPPRRRVRDLVRDAALRVLADGERAVVRPRQPRIPLIARRADIYQSAVERREARVADVVRRVREDDRVDDRADAGRGLAEAPRDIAAVLEDERRAERALLFVEQRLVVPCAPPS